MRDFDEITHIITSVNKNNLCRRTLKYLQGVLEGKWIVDPTCKLCKTFYFLFLFIFYLWFKIIGLIDSMKSKKWQSEEKYLVQGDQASGETHAPSRGKEQNVIIMYAMHLTMNNKIVCY